MQGLRSDSGTNWYPALAEFLALVHPPKPWPVQMENYQKGVDNKSVDVHLSPKFVARVRSLVHGMIQQDVSTHYWGKPNKTLPTADLDQFRNAYDSLMDVAIHQEQERVTAVDWIRLGQLGVFKFLIQAVALELQELRQRLESSRDDSRESGKSLQHHQNLVILARESGAVSYRVFRRLFSVVERLEGTRLRRLRKSKLGMSWPIPQDVLFNTLLQLPALLGEEMAAYHYPMLCLGTNGRTNRDIFNLCLTGVFRNYLPAWTQPRGSMPGMESTSSDIEDGGSTPLRVLNRLDQGNLRGFMETEIVLNQFLTEEEYKQAASVSWLDDPGNLVRLLSLSSNPSPDKAAMIPAFPNDETTQRWRQFMRNIREELFQRIDESGITQDIIASYWTTRLCQSLPPNTSPRLVYEYFTGQLDRQKTMRRLGNNAAEGQDLAAIIKVLDNALVEIKQIPKEQRRKYVGRALVDFLGLRRDLKLAYKTFEAMDQIRVFTDEKNLALSRANNLLHEFLLAEEQQGEQRIVCHTILKADLRGSSKVTTMLRAKKLNPATHFSQNFFNPITACLEDFGASKVFVEGDAVILSILEYKGDAKGARSVSWACGVGAEILNIVARHNIINRRYDLPDLELGLGIAFVNEEPTFLHDGDHQIMISSAINLADRLSSCAKVLRDAPFAKSGRPFRVEVLVPPAGSDATAGAKTDVLRYNVNGIEMDEAAFNKLKTELTLRPLYVKIGGQMETLHVGRYPDRNDHMHWLVVRESPLHIWEWGEISKHPAEGDKMFYEVIVDQDLIDRIRAKLNPNRDDRSVLNAPFANAAPDDS